VKLALGGGVEVDLATRDEIRSDLDAELSARGLPSRPSPVSFWVKRTGSAIATSSGLVVIPLGGPNTGRKWNVMALAVLGTDWFTPVTNTGVGFFITEESAILPGASPPSGDVYLPGSAGGVETVLPANAQFSRNQCVVPDPYKAAVAVTGLATGQNVTAIIYCWDDPIEMIAGQ